MAPTTRASRLRERRDAAWPGTTVPFHVTTGNGSAGSGPRMMGPAASSTAITAVLSAAARAGRATDAGFGACGTGGTNATVFSATAGAGFKAFSRAATKSRHRSHRAAGTFDMPRMITASTFGGSL